MAKAPGERSAKFVGPPRPKKSPIGLRAILIGVAEPGRKYRVGQVLEVIFQASPYYFYGTVLSVDLNGGVEEVSAHYETQLTHIQSVATFPVRWTIYGADCRLTFSYID